MNSRDAAYEEEQLRRAIEESKREGGALSTNTGTRKSKRSRSESEECVSQPAIAYSFQSPKMTDKSLHKGVRETRRGSELLRTLHLRIPKAKAAGRLQSRTTKLRIRNASRISEVLPLETTETKKSVTERLSENENAPMQVQGSVGQDENETKVFSVP